MSLSTITDNIPRWSTHLPRYHHILKVSSKKLWDIVFSLERIVWQVKARRLSVTKTKRKRRLRIKTFSWHNEDTSFFLYLYCILWMLSILLSILWKYSWQMLSLKKALHWQSKTTIYTEFPWSHSKITFWNDTRNVVGARKNFAKCNGVLRFSEADMSRVADGELIHYVQGVIRTWVNNPR